MSLLFEGMKADVRKGINHHRAASQAAGLSAAPIRYESSPALIPNWPFSPTVQPPYLSWALS